jgi:arylsulfatase A-like enzyme
VLDIGGLQLRILDPAVTEHVFPLAGVPERGTLVFSVGLPMTEPVRFEVEVRCEGEDPTLLYEKEVLTPGWIAERVDFVAPGGADARLVFRATPRRRETVGPARPAWGDPVLLPATATDRPSVVLVSLDTLRADRVGAYGRPGAATPSLDALAREGLLYEEAYSPSTWTLPSHQSMLTGVYPRGAHKNAPPLAEVLREAGWLTAAFTGGGWLSRSMGFDRGFDTFFAYQHRGHPLDAARFDGGAVFAQATTWLERRAGAPFFLFVHTYDVHDRNPFFAGVTDLGRIQKILEELPPGRREEMSAYYDRLIGEVDQKLGALLATIDRLQIGRRTLVVVTSDHGEAMWEHGNLSGHGCHLKPYEEITRVPLLMRWTGRVPAGRRLPGPVSLVDLVPTILALVGVPAPPELEGIALPVLGSEEAPIDGAATRAIFVQCDAHLVVREGDHKLITARGHPASDELYDLRRDPRERASLVITSPDQLAALRARANDYWQGTPPRKDPPVPLEQMDDATRERLRALGYVR